jgi:oligopeptidase B
MRRLFAAAALAATSALAQAQSASTPPTVAQKPYAVKGPLERNDPYYWLRDDKRKNPDMLAYLKAENAYADSVLAPTKALREKLYSEIISRIKQDDSSVPFRRRGYWYYSRFEKGQDYPVIARKAGTLKAKEQVLLDEPTMAKGHAFFAVGEYNVSQNNRLMAYALDTVGRRQYVLKVKDLATGKTLADAVKNVEPNLVWADDNRTIYYIEKDPVTLLSKRVKRHVLGTPASADKLVYEEKDDSFYMGVGRTSDDKFICIYLQSTVSNEQRCTSAAKPAKWSVLALREREFRYEADHVGDHWIIRTNAEGAKNYKLATLRDADAAKGRSAWTDLVPHQADVFIENFQPFNSFIAIEERAGGNKHIRLLKNDGTSSDVASDEAAYAMAIGTNREVNATKLRYSYDSLTTPRITYEVDTATGERTVLKRTPAPNYDASQYETERVWATARDGTKIPVSLVYKKGFKKDGTAAMLLYGYVSYGLSMDPSWSS